MDNKNNQKSDYFKSSTLSWRYDDTLDQPYDPPKDMVNSPSHYTQGRFEAIDIIEDAIEHAPNAMAAMCQGTALKYLLRLWHKIDSKEDAEKARWYLNKLIDSIE